MIILYLLSCATNKDSENVKNHKERAYETYQKDEHQEQSIIEDQPSIHKNYPEEVQKVLPSLISRHSVPCRELPKTSIDSFHFIVENIQRPPWAAMRSAQCMLEIYPSEGMDIYKNWIHGTDTLGLAILIANQIEQLPNNVQNVLFPHFSTSPHLEKIKTTILSHKDELGKTLSKENVQILQSLEE